MELRPSPVSAHHKSTGRLSVLWLRLKREVASLHVPIVEVRTWSKEQGLGSKSTYETLHIRPGSVYAENEMERCTNKN